MLNKKTSYFRLMKNSFGLTLIELLIVLIVISITLVFGIPSFKEFMVNNRLTASVNDMVTALQIARSESIKRIKFAGVSIPSGGGNNWYTFIEVSDIATYPNNLIQRYQAESGVTVTANDETPKYRPDGRLDSNVPIVMHFSITGSSSTRTLTISPSGRVAVSNP